MFMFTLFVSFDALYHYQAKIRRQKSITMLFNQNIKKSQNTIFGYKKWWNFEFDNILWQTINENCILYNFSLILWKYFFMVRSHGFDGLFGAFDVAWRTKNHFQRGKRQNFFKAFHAENWKTSKYIFWLQKGVNFWIWPHFFHSEPKNYISFHFSMIFWTYFFMVRSHGFDGLFGAFDVACCASNAPSKSLKQMPDPFQKWKEQTDWFRSEI